MLEGRTVHIPDVLVDPEYDYGEGQKIGGYRTLLGVPLMREGAAVGALLLGRAAPRPFTPQQIELLEILCRSGGDRHRERAAVRRNPGQEPAA